MSLVVFFNTNFRKIQKKKGGEEVATITAS